MKKILKQVQDDVLSHTNSNMSDQPTLYDQIGETHILKLVDDFYEGVEEDELIRKLYPKDLEPAKDRLKLFLVQALGGPTTYSEQRGHPMLRRRHFQWKIGEEQATHWLQHMHKALEKATFSEELKDAFWNYVYKAALHMINQ